LLLVGGQRRQVRVDSRVGCHGPSIIGGESAPPPPVWLRRRFATTPRIPT
jgi:hypothetical protein